MIQRISLWRERKKRRSQLESCCREPPSQVLGRLSAQWASGKARVPYWETQRNGSSCGQTERSLAHKLTGTVSSTTLGACAPRRDALKDWGKCMEPSEGGPGAVGTGRLALPPPHMRHSLGRRMSWSIRTMALMACPSFLTDKRTKKGKMPCILIPLSEAFIIIQISQKAELAPINCTGL